MAFKMPELNLTNAAIALAIAVLAIKFRKNILDGLMAVPFAGPAVAKFANS